jgi:HAE1 family hydrophobic/amphiphilic exporter-1
MGIAATIVPNLAVDLYPSTTMPVLSVFTSYPGAGPADVEQNVTQPLERALASTQGLVNMSSSSSFQNSSIILLFNYGTNMDKAMTDAQTLVSRLGNSLPSGAGSPTVFRFDMSSSPIIRLIVRGNYPPDQLRLFAENEIQSSIERIAGVAAAEVTGGTTQLIQVAVSLNRLAAFNLSLSDVSSALRGQSILSSGGNLRRGTREYQIMTQEVLDSLDQIKRLVVKTVNISGGTGQVNRSQVVRLEDVADISIAHNDNAVRVYVNGETGVYIQVTSESDSNQIQVSKNVRDALEGINNSLPQGITLELLSDNTTMIRSTLSQVYTSAIQGAILAMLVLFLFLRNIKGTLIIGLAIPISVLLTLMFMSIFGFTLNLLTMTGLIIAMGMTIDGSIVILENIHSYRERGAKSRIAAVLGSREMLRAIITSCTTTICVFVPLIIYRNDLGGMGLMFNDLIFTVVIALAISLIVAITLVPCLCGAVLPLNTRKQKPLKIWSLRFIDDKMEALFRSLEKGYKKGLDYCLSHRLIIILFVVVLMALSVTQFTGMNMNLYGRSFTDDNININISLPQGTVIDETEALLFKLEDIIKKEVRGYQNIILTSRRTGTTQGSIQITLPEPARQIDTPADIIAKLTPYLSSFPEASISFWAGRGIGSGSAVDLALSSRNNNSIMETANEIVSIINRYLPEIENPVINIDEGAPQLQIDIDRDRAAALGISLSTIASEIRAAMDGTTATTITIGDRLMNVNVGLRAADKVGMPNLDAIFVMSRNGSRISLSNFASVVEGRSPSSIRRENQERVVRITGQLAPGIAATQMQRILEDTVKEHLVTRQDVTVRYLGEAQEIASYWSIFGFIILAAIFLVYGVMASQFESFVDPLIIFFSVPLLLIGVVWIYKITGQTMTMFSLVGVVALVGVVTNNGIILVDYTNTLRARGYKVREACLEAGRTRLRPILMTSLSTILAMVPIAFFPGPGTDDIQPIAKTFIGGLTVSSFMTLFLVPVLYSVFNNWRDRRKKALLDIESAQLP